MNLIETLYILTGVNNEGNAVVIATGQSSKLSKKAKKLKKKYTGMMITELKLEM
jgi:hypothetical protein